MTREEALERMEARYSNLKAKSAEVAESGMERIAEVGGGAAAGYADAEWSDKKVLGFPVQQVVGGALAIGGVLGFGGKYANTLGAAGGGMLAYEAGKATFKARMEKKKNAPAATTAGVGASHQLGAGAGPAVTGRNLDQALTAVQQGR